MPASPKRPVEPARPIGMELIFIYACPYCGKEVPVLAPVTPTMARCDVCERHFPVVPVDERSLYFIRIMLQNGSAAIDPDFA